MNELSFFTPMRYVQEQPQGIESPRGRLLIAGCPAGDTMAANIVERYRQYLVEAEDESEILHLTELDYAFSDSELCVRLERDVSGYDVFLCQSLYNPTV